VWIYNKGGDGGEDALANQLGIPRAQVRSLPNVGRESHTYLSHVIAEYNSLPDRMIFVQGNPFDHIRGCPMTVTRDSAESLQTWFDTWTNEIDTHGITVSNLINSHGHEITSPGWRIHEWAGPLEPAPAALGPWMRAYVDIADFPSPQFLWYMGACFGVSRLSAARRSREYFERLRDQVSTRNPEAGHFMERSWFYIFRG
jgi:hypothetical protein